ncbi:MAG TPA: maleylacetate reductase [Gemmatimonadaceae bacterium]
MSFAYHTHAVRVVFGAGSVESLPVELERHGMRRPFLLMTPGRSAQRAIVERLLGDRMAGAFCGARLHVPVEVVGEALAAVRGAAPDGLLAFGGGSAIGLGKAMAFETKLPVAVVATTYSGSEMTAVWGISDGRMKRTFRNAEVAPQLVLYDPVLTYGLSPAVSAASGMNAIAHCVEAEYAPEQNPVTSCFAGGGLRRLAATLPVVMQAPQDERARSEALLGAHLAGRALDMTSMGLEHKLAHVLGGRFGLNHAEAHAAIVPWVTAWNAPAAPGPMARLAEALGAPDAADALIALARTLGIRPLGQLGFTAADIPEAAGLIMAMTFPNPRPVDADGVRWILEHALTGRGSDL